MLLKMICSFVVSFVISFIAAKLFIPMLVKLKVGQSIKEIGPYWHKGKNGTPTMGGIIFISGIFLTVLFVGIKCILAGDVTHLLLLIFALIYGAIGFVDDYCKLKKKENTGLSAGQKFALQCIAALIFVFAMWKIGVIKPELYVPFFNISVHVPLVLYFILAVFIIVGCVNAVNLTDGIDGLATGVSLPVSLYYVVVSAIWGFSSQGIFAAALTGALAAFLIFNFHPAKVFMGDTGSLFLGGAICALAFSLDMPLILIPLGIVYIIETLSDIIQVGYYKLTHGKRIFKMAPIHHHFEMCGWSEIKIFIVFTAVSLVFSIISWFAVRYRF